MSTIIQALLNTVMGMGTVFIVLIFISFLISLFKYIPELEKKFSKKKQPEIEVQAPVAPIVVDEEDEDDDELVDDSELVAVITAGLYASLSQKVQGAVSADKLVVRSIKRAKR